MDYTKVNIHYLRAYAREIGVKSPTSYKKDVLIQKIKQVESGEIEPFFSKIGRPSNEKTICKPMLQKVKTESNDKSLLLFVVDRFKEFLDKLEKEIEDKF